MATFRQYDHPNYTVRREANASSLAGAGTSAVSADFRTFQAIKLFNAHYYVTTAGTLTSAAFQLINITKALATTTIATTTVGTAVAGQRVSVNTVTTPVTPTSVAADSRTVVLGFNDASLTAAVVYEYEVDPAGAFTAIAG